MWALTAPDMVKTRVFDRSIGLLPLADYSPPFDEPVRMCPNCPGNRLTPSRRPTTFKVCPMGVSKIQIGQLWKKDGTSDVYLVTRLYSEALRTMVILRKSGAEDEAQIKVRVERTSAGQTIPGFSPATDD